MELRNQTKTKRRYFPDCFEAGVLEATSIYQSCAWAWDLRGKTETEVTFLSHFVCFCSEAHVGNKDFSVVVARRPHTSLSSTWSPAPCGYWAQQTYLSHMKLFSEYNTHSGHSCLCTKTINKSFLKIKYYLHFTQIIFWGTSMLVT